MTDETVHDIPKRTTPTWDMELLISGATAFGLLQVPALIDSWAIWALTENQVEVQQFLFTLTLYMQFSVLTLIITFLLHLLMRGYWVALVGMHSVYPEGVRWDHFRKSSPVATERLLKKTADFGTLIEAADNRATWVFGFGFGLALVMVWPVLLVGTLSVILLIAQKFEWPMGPISVGFWIVFAVLILPIVVVGFIDRVFGEKWLAEDRTRTLERVYRFYHRIGMSRAQNPLLAIATSQGKSNSTTTIIVIAVSIIMLGVSASTVMRMAAFESGAFDGLPAMNAGGKHELFQSHYGDLRDKSGTANSPFIPARVVRGDYLPLFVPYRPIMMNRVLAKECPESLLPSARDAGDGLRCMARLLDVHLDNQSLAIELFAATDGASGQRGAVAMIDIAALPRGRHVLKLNRLQKRDDDVPPEDRVHVIEFWR